MQGVEGIMQMDGHCPPGAIGVTVFPKTHQKGVILQRVLLDREAYSTFNRMTSSIDLVMMGGSSIKS